MTEEKFCYECSGKVGFVDIQKEQEINLEDIIDNENLCRDYQSDTHMTVHSNTANGTIQIEENEQVSISPELISERISEFKKAHKEDIEKIEAFIGEKVNVEFFIIYDYS